MTDKYQELKSEHQLIKNDLKSIEELLHDFTDHTKKTPLISISMVLERQLLLENKAKKLEIEIKKLKKN